MEKAEKKKTKKKKGKSSNNNDTPSNTPNTTNGPSNNNSEQSGGVSTIKGYAKSAASAIGNKTGITEAIGLQQIPGVDLNCDYLNLTMADVNHCWFKGSKKCKSKYAHKMGIKKNTKYVPTFKFFGNLTGLSHITLDGLRDPILISKLTNKELEKRLNTLLERLPQGNCICRNFVPTGIFQVDWKYFRLCFLNFKQVIAMAREKGKSPDFIETKLRDLFIDDFFTNFSGDFVEYRDILLKFGEKYRKLCKLQLRFLLPANKILYARALGLRNVVKGYDEPLKELAVLMKEKEAADREAYRKFKKLDMKKDLK